MTNMIAAERLYLTGDAKRLVREGDPDGASLYVAAGDEIPPSSVERFGLVDGTLPAKGGKGAGGGSTKEKQPGQDKEKQPGGDKGAGGGSTGSAATGAVANGDDLTRIKYVGTKVAKGFSAAGLTSFAQIAAIDPAAPPAVEGTNATTKWADIVESAKELLASVAGVEGPGAGEAAGGGEVGAGAADQGAS